MPKRIAALMLACTCALAVASAASAAPGMKVGIYDDAQTIGNTNQAFDQLSELRTQVVRVTLNWREAAPTRPVSGLFADPSSYRWGQYDQVVRAAQARGIQVIFTILWTPAWAGGGPKGKLVPRSMAYLQSFARAAATRYSGVYPDPEPPVPGAMLPRVRYWTAWNEPNGRLFLKPQYKRVRGRFVIWSAIQYAKMCTAVFKGVHNAESAAGVAPRGKVACGVLNPGGNNNARGARGAPTPLRFMEAMRARNPKFDVFAHHPYAGTSRETPTSIPRPRGRIGLGNLGVLIAEMNRLGWGSKRLWLTEYAYQTKPPDGHFGVTPRKQAAYLRQAYRIAKRTRRVDMFVWFLLKDELEVGRWQSGLIWSFPTRAGVKKPAYAAFRALRG
jgi:hypothetical protein